MEKVERMKLVDENGKTILMTKSEYLELAKQKGWDVKIPRLEDGTYDCDVFGGDGVHFHAGFVISGILCLGSHAFFAYDVSAHSGILLKDKAYTYALSAINGNIIIGNDADVCQLTGKNVICGDNLITNGCNLSATDGDVIIGFNSELNGEAFDGKVSASKDFICDDEPAV